MFTLILKGIKRQSSDFPSIPLIGHSFVADIVAYFLKVPKIYVPGFPMFIFKVGNLFFLERLEQHTLPISHSTPHFHIQPCVWIILISILSF